MSFFDLFAETVVGGADVYVDLGTANTLVAVRGKGLLVNEPTLIAYGETTPGKKKVVGVGKEAQEKIARTPGVLSTYRPLKEGVIADADVTETLLRTYFERLNLKKLFRRPRVILSLPYGVTEVEKRAAIQAGKASGAKEVILIDEPMAAAIGSGIPIEAPQGHLILDLGGGTSEVAVICLADIVYCKAVRYGGHHFDEAIQNYLRAERSLIVSDSTAEKLKIDLGTATPKKDIRSSQVMGRDAKSGLQKQLEVTSEEVGYAMDDGLNNIISLIHSALEQTPPELVSDIIETGLTLTGGGALIRDLDLRLENEVRLPIQVSPEPLLAIARGGETLLSKPELLEKIRLTLD